MSAIYESQKLLSEYLLFHYGTAEQILPSTQSWPQGMHDALDFAVRTTVHFSNKKVARGLDLGCAVGRSTFEMARNCEEVIGIDFSHAFIHAASELQRGESLVYQRTEEAAQMTYLTASAPNGIDFSRVRFEQGDAMNLAENLGTFDRVHAANLLCRLPEPMKLIDRLPSLVNPGGELTIATPCTWLAEFTPPNNWPTPSTFNWLKSTLGKHFELLHEQDEPFLIRETARKFQWTRSMLTVWKRTL